MTMRFRQTMEFQRLSDLMALLRCRIQTNRMALVGGNHTAARSVLLRPFVERLSLRCEKDMDLVGEFPRKSRTKMKKFRSGRIVLNPDSLLVIKLPDSKTLRVLSRSVFLVMAILTLPCMASILRGHSGSFLNATDYHPDSEFGSFDFLNLLCRDLLNEGLIKKGHRALVLSAVVDIGTGDLRFMDDNEINLVMESDLQRKNSLSDEEFDVVLVAGSVDSKFVNRILKVGGIVAMQLSDDISNVYQEQSNYRIAYLRKYSSIVVAMRKMGRMISSFSAPNRKLMVLEDKKSALKGLEDVLLEPPRKALVKPKKFLRKIKFLPDLLADSLERYPRRMFVHVGSPEETKGIMKWFDNKYPKRDQAFESYSFEVVLAEEASIDISDWLTKNVKGDEYIVMKANAEVVERMIYQKTVTLVDELFLECNNQWQHSGQKKTKRAYWHCLALYGRLKDEGIAVRQWWS